VWWLIGEYTQELTVAYREAAAELLLAGARERSALVEALFTGGIPDRDTLWEAAKMLRLPWEGVFVVVAAEAPAGRECARGAVWPLLIVGVMEPSSVVLFTKAQSIFT